MSILLSTFTATSSFRSITVQVVWLQESDHSLQCPKVPEIISLHPQPHHTQTLSLQSFPSSPAPLILPTQSARTGNHNGYPLANCNRANKSNKDSDRKKPTSYRSSWVHRHSTKHATRHILEAQCAFKVLMIPKSCNSHYVSHFAAFFIVVGA